MKKISLFYLFLSYLIWLSPAYSQTGESSAFILYSPLQSSTTTLIDTLGNVFNTWVCSKNPASTAYLLKDGSIMRPYKVSNPTMTAGAVGGGIEIRDWNNNVTWSFTWSEQLHQQHHEIIPIIQPDGSYNALLIAWERKSNAEAIQAGRQNISGEMWPEEIVEIQPVGSDSGIVVWEWHSWDHLCQDVNSSKDNYYSDGCDNHPELIDINIGNISGQGGDWIHANGMDYDPILDRIVFSSHSLDEIYVIDRSTTTAEAATNSGGNSGKGGDILYRWGMPSNYGAIGIQELYVVHGVNFIDECLPGAGNIILFNNGNRSGQNNDYSSVLEIIPPVNGYNYDLPWNQTATWMYEDNPAFYANHLSGCFRLKNGNTLATEGTSAHIIEVDPTGIIVFDYSVPGFNSQLAKAVGYDPSYPGLGLIPPLSLSTTSTDETSNGSCDGTATTTAAGGSGPYIYIWDDPASQTNAIATGLCAGTYSVTISDSNCDEIYASVTINAGASNNLSVTTTSIDANCNASDGSATATVSGGTPPYIYQWNDPLAQTGSTATGLAAGSYSVTVTDANSDIVITQVNLSNLGTGTFNSTVDNVTCNGFIDGAITAAIQGGASPFDYNWSNGVTSSSLIYLVAGFYTVTVTDANGCIITETVEVTEPESIVLVMAYQNVSSDTTCDGQAIANVTGGTSPYSYQWDTMAASQTTQTAVGLCMGTYNVTVTDGNSCTSISSVFVDSTVMGINKMEFIHQLKIYPNPFTESTTIEFDNKNAEPYLLVVYNLLGNKVRVMHNITAGKVVVEKGNLTPGVYFIEVSSGNTVAREKVIIK